jgi:hypothetical protein
MAVPIQRIARFRNAPELENHAPETHIVPAKQGSSPSAVFRPGTGVPLRLQRPRQVMGGPRWLQCRRARRKIGEESTHARARHFFVADFPPHPVSKKKLKKSVHPMFFAGGI